MRGYTASLDPARAAQAAWSCQLHFDNGVFASLVYSGFAHFDSDELMGWIGEMGQKKDAAAYWTSRMALQGDELKLKNARNYGGEGSPPAGCASALRLFLVSCEKADLRPMPHGVMIYARAERRLEPLPAPAIPRAEVIDELYGAIVEGREPLHSGEWAMATVEVCLALLRSSREGRGRSLNREERLAHLTKEAWRAFVRALQTRLAAHGVPFGHWTFLRVLWEEDGITQRALSEAAGVAEPSTATAIRSMEELGYVTRRQVRGNRKNVYVHDRQGPCAEGEARAAR